MQHFGGLFLSAMQIRHDLLSLLLKTNDPAAAQIKKGQIEASAPARRLRSQRLVGRRGGGRLNPTIKRLNSPRIGLTGSRQDFSGALRPASRGLLAAPTPGSDPAARPYGSPGCGTRSSPSPPPGPGEPLTLRTGAGFHRPAAPRRPLPPPPPPNTHTHPFSSAASRSTHLLGHGVDEANVEILFRPDP